MGEKLLAQRLIRLLRDTYGRSSRTALALLDWAADQARLAVARYRVRRARRAPRQAARLGSAVGARRRDRYGGAGAGFVRVHRRGSDSARLRSVRARAAPHRRGVRSDAPAGVAPRPPVRRRRGSARSGRPARRRGAGRSGAARAALGSDGARPALRGRGRLPWRRPRRRHRLALRQGARRGSHRARRADRRARRQAPAGRAGRRGFRRAGGAVPAARPAPRRRAPAAAPRASTC